MTYTWTITYEHEGAKHTTVMDTSCRRSCAEAAAEFEARHDVKVITATLAWQGERKVERGLKGQSLPHNRTEAKPFTAEQLQMF